MFTIKAYLNDFTNALDSVASSPAMTKMTKPYIHIFLPTLSRQDSALLGHRPKVRPCRARPGLYHNYLSRPIKGRQRLIPIRRRAQATDQGRTSQIGRVGIALRRLPSSRCLTYASHGRAAMILGKMKSLLDSEETRTLSQGDV